ncbi:cytochrome P450 [Dactylosporangium sp. NPDC049742]|uniref:cytochrome P450 family protein n=1 Tax=Dactylosporangium sp. NPDC049742 TaxID=3154737 RepID=UPI003416A546
MTTAPSTPLFTQDFWDDPHPVYAAMREQAPVHRLQLPTGMEMWLVTRYADARSALGDPRLSKRVGATANAAALAREVSAPLTRHLLANDPPDHTRLRRLVAKAFTARRVEQLRGRVEELSAALIAGMAEREHGDVIDDYAVQLPIQVICELLGIPQEDQTEFRRWTGVLVAGSVERAGVPEAAASFLAYLRTLIATKRAEPADDLLSALIATTDEGDRLDEDELTSMVFLLLIAGHETTVNLIGNGMWTLLTRPEEHRRLLADPALIPRAVEEFLRLESPVETATFRVAMEPVTYGGITIPAGAVVAISLLSADRDPDRFPDPAAVDLDRPDNQHLAFGHGIHYCLGAPLARLEAQIAFRDLLAAFPAMRLAVPASELIWRPGVLIHGTTTLPVHLG